MDEPDVKVTVEGDGEGEGEGEHQAHPEAIADASAVVVATAGAAAALAQETAAHAELQAAEEVQEVAQEQDEWRTMTANQMAELGTGLANLSEQLALMRSDEEQRQQSETLLLERLLRLEEAELSRSSTPPASEEAETAEERTETAPIVGTEASANLGPAEAGGEISLGATKPAPPNPNAGAKVRVLRRWI